MDFLKKDIFYPSNGKYNEELINNANTKYDAYLESIKNKLPKNLIKFYNSEDRFHDYAIRKVVVLGNALCYGAKSDKIILELCFDEIEITIEFDSIYYLKLINDNKDSCWVSTGEKNENDSMVGLEEIVLCELGYIKDNVFKFELLSSSGTILEIHFSKVKIIKSIRKF